MIGFAFKPASIWRPSHLATMLALLVLSCSEPRPSANDAGHRARAPQQEVTLTAVEHDALAALMTRFLDQAEADQEMIAAPGLEDHIFALRPMDSRFFYAELMGGRPYRVIGVCDNECTDVDVEISDPDGWPLARDVVWNDDFPVVNFTPARDGPYAIHVMMRRCSVAPCYAGLRVLSAGREAAP